MEVDQRVPRGNGHERCCGGRIPGLLSFALNVRCLQVENQPDLLVELRERASLKAAYSARSQAIEKGNLQLRRDGDVVFLGARFCRGHPNAQ